MQIIRYPSLTEWQVLGCLSAFVDALFEELSSTGMWLRKLEGSGKGAAFAFEMKLDAHRYGALLVLERWSGFAAAFAPHVRLSRYPEILAEAGKRAAAAETVLARMNEVIDGSERYSPEIVEACQAAFQAVVLTFEEERRAAEQTAKLGPMAPEEFQEARRVFQGDLAAR